MITLIENSEGFEPLQDTYTDYTSPLIGAPEPTTTLEKPVTKWGYCRVSHAHQIDGHSLDLQEQELISYGVPKENIFREQASGMSRDREELTKLLKKIKPRDELHVTTVCRLSRSMRYLLELFWWLGDRDAVIHAGNKPYQGLLGGMLLSVEGFSAENQYQSIRSKCNAGIQRGVLAGNFRGRQSSLGPSEERKLKRYHSQGMSRSETARLMKIAPATVSRHKERLGLTKKRH